MGGAFEWGRRSGGFNWLRAGFERGLKARGDGSLGVVFNPWRETLLGDVSSDCCVGIRFCGVGWFDAKRSFHPISWSADS